MDSAMDGLNLQVPSLLAACEAAKYWGDVLLTFKAGRVTVITSGQEMREADQVTLMTRRLLGHVPGSTNAAVPP